MSHIYHVMYDINTLTIIGISGTPYDKIPNGMSTSLVEEKDGEDFIEGRKRLHDYFVNVKDNLYADFVPKGSWISFVNKKPSEDNILLDLDSRDSFFEYAEIKFEQLGDGVILTFNEDNINPIIKSHFNQYKDTDFTIYVTLYQNTSALVNSLTMKLDDLIRNKTVKFFAGTNKKISLWGAR